jgi:ubiquinone/menaquinone biosynthesis C-methylase UbiE
VSDAPLPVGDPATLKAQVTYDTAADHFDDPRLGFWARTGQRTVERLALKRGARVLDVASGTGASALPAADAVGPAGRVVAVDLADRLLAHGRAKAAARGLRNLEFRLADMTALDYPEHHFDAVVCVFGIFFVSDMESLLRDLWRMVRPGGALAVTTWGERFFAPAYAVWNTAVARRRPDLVAAFNPWDRITTPEAVRALLAHASGARVTVDPEDAHQALAAPEDFWIAALGSGLRWTIEQLGPVAAEDVRREVVDRLRAESVRHLETNVIYGVARRP